MWRANRGKIKQRLTEERQNNRELGGKVRHYEINKKVTWNKVSISVGVLLGIWLNYVFYSDNVDHFARGVAISSLMVIWLTRFKYEE